MRLLVFIMVLVSINSLMGKPISSNAVCVRVTIPAWGVCFLIEANNPSALYEELQDVVSSKVHCGWGCLNNWDTETYNRFRDDALSVSKLAMHLSSPGQNWSYTTTIGNFLSGLYLPTTPPPFRSCLEPAELAPVGSLDWLPDQNYTDDKVGDTPMLASLAYYIWLVDHHL